MSLSRWFGCAAIKQPTTNSNSNNDKILSIRWNETAPFVLDVVSFSFSLNVNNEDVRSDPPKLSKLASPPVSITRVPNEFPGGLYHQFCLLQRSWSPYNIPKSLTSKKIPLQEFRYSLLTALNRGFCLLNKCCNDDDVDDDDEDRGDCTSGFCYNSSFDYKLTLNNLHNFGELFQKNWVYNFNSHLTYYIEHDTILKLQQSEYFRHVSHDDDDEEDERFGYLVIELKNTNETTVKFGVNIISSYIAVDIAANVVDPSSSDKPISYYLFFNKFSNLVFIVFLTTGTQTAIIPPTTEDLVNDETLKEMKTCAWFHSPIEPVFSVDMDNVVPVNKNSVLTRYTNSRFTGLHGLILPANANTRMILPSSLIRQYIYRRAYGARFHTNHEVCKL